MDIRNLIITITAIIMALMIFGIELLLQRWGLFSIHESAMGAALLVFSGYIVHIVSDIIKKRKSKN